MTVCNENLHNNVATEAKKTHTMVHSWAITLFIVTSGAGFLIMVAAIVAMKPRRSSPPSMLQQLVVPAPQNAPAHQSVPAHLQSAPAHQNASEDSASADSEFAAEVQVALSAVSRGSDDDIELSTLSQTQGRVPHVRQSASDESEASIETLTRAQTEEPNHPVDQA